VEKHTENEIPSYFSIENIENYYSIWMLLFILLTGSRVENFLHKKDTSKVFTGKSKRWSGDTWDDVVQDDGRLLVIKNGVVADWESLKNGRKLVISWRNSRNETAAYCT